MVAFISLKAQCLTQSYLLMEHLNRLHAQELWALPALMEAETSFGNLALWTQMRCSEHPTQFILRHLELIALSVIYNE